MIFVSTKSLHHNEDENYAITQTFLFLFHSHNVYTVWALCVVGYCVVGYTMQRFDEYLKKY